MYEKLKHKERSHHLEESEEIRLYHEYNVKKTENVSVSKGAGEQEGARAASVIEHSGSTGSSSKGQTPGLLCPLAREGHAWEN